MGFLRGASPGYLVIGWSVSPNYWACSEIGGISSSWISETGQILWPDSGKLKELLDF